MVPSYRPPHLLHTQDKIIALPALESLALRARHRTARSSAHPGSAAENFQLVRDRPGSSPRSLLRFFGYCILLGPSLIFGRLKMSSFFLRFVSDNPSLKRFSCNVTLEILRTFIPPFFRPERLGKESPSKLFQESS